MHPVLIVSAPAWVEGHWRREVWAPKKPPDCSGRCDTLPRECGEEKYARGLDNSGNIEGSLKGIFTPPLPPSASTGGCGVRAALAAPPARGCSAPQCRARQGAVWTGGAGWGTGAPRGFLRARASGRSVEEGEGGALAPQRRPRLYSTSRDTVAAARAWWYGGRRRRLRRPACTYGRSCPCIGKVS